MRLLKAQNTNLRNIYGKGVKYDIDDQIIMDSTNVALIPKGTGNTAYSAGTPNNQRPASPTEGHIRYNTTTDEFEAYQNGAWREIRFKEPNQDPGIVQQNAGLGAGIGSNKVIFGPLNSGDSDYPAPAAAQNILVFVENVFQIATTNYLLEQNPSFTYEGAEVNATSISNGTEYYIIAVDDGIGGAATDFTLIGAANNNPGTVFTATGAGTGTGTVRETGYYLRFTSEPDLNKVVTVLHNFDK